MLILELLRADDFAVMRTSYSSAKGSPSSFQDSQQ